MNLQLGIASSGGVLGYWTPYGKTTAQLPTSDDMIGTHGEVPMVNPGTIWQVPMVNPDIGTKKFTKIKNE